MINNYTDSKSKNSKNINNNNSTGGENKKKYRIDNKIEEEFWTKSTKTVAIFYLITMYITSILNLALIKMCENYSPKNIFMGIKLFFDTLILIITSVSINVNYNLTKISGEHFCFQIFSIFYIVIYILYHLFVTFYVFAVDTCQYTNKMINIISVIPNNLLLIYTIYQIITTYFL